ncbi:MAG TPA: hypothetical protein PLI95_20210 [Polyangiaceae bacterium]|nr:hypothetical protein [Polyangiaceae bacterium]
MAKGERAEIIEREMLDRVLGDLAGALRRKPAHEDKLAGALRVLGPHSAALQKGAAEAFALLVKRESFARELYPSLARMLAEHASDLAAPSLAKALGAEDAGGFSTLSACCHVSQPVIAEPLARVASSRHAHLAFAAEVARMARGESDGTHLVAIAPKIKESHRIALCVEIFVPLTRAGKLPASAGPALAVLRDAERHLGRWLVLAEVATRATDPGPLAEALSKAKNGPGSARSAWSLVAWALSPEPKALPSARPTVEIIARLSDRPSADRDTTFLFRLAAARAASVKPMLETFARTLPLADEVAVRAALYLARDHGRDDLRAALEGTAKGSKREDLRGLAIAALWDAGAKQEARALADEAGKAKSLPTAVWANLVRIAAETASESPVVDEPTLRRVQWGWLE